MSSRVKEIEAGQGQIFPGQYMAMDPMGGQVQLPGQHMLEPTFGLPATWIDGALRDEAQLRGYTVVDAATVLSTHLTEILKAHMAELLSHIEVQKLLKELPKEHADLVKEIVPAQISTTGIQRVLQLLLAERVSIRDLGTIVEGVAEVAGTLKNPRDIVEHVRVRLARQICAAHAAPAGHLPIITLSPPWEGAFLEAIVGEGDNRHLAMQPSRLTEFVHAVRDRFEDARPPRRDAGPRHLGAVAPLRALDHRALPPRDAGDLAGRDPRPGAAEDGGKRVKPLVRLGLSRGRVYEPPPPSCHRR